MHCFHIVPPGGFNASLLDMSVTHRLINIPVLNIILLLISPTVATYEIYIINQYRVEDGGEAPHLLHQPKIAHCIAFPLYRSL